MREEQRDNVSAAAFAPACALAKQDVVQQQSAERAVTAFQGFLTTPLETQPARHHHTSTESAALALFRDVVAHVPAYRDFSTQQGISHRFI